MTQLADKQALRQKLDTAVTQAGRIVLGKDHAIRLALACLLARGHLLIEDLPGMGKTTLAQVLARVLGLRFNRIQFTSDLLPADILGVSVFEAGSGGFEFRPGPVFAQLILADEVNRSTPKTQSALLEAMEEYQVTVDGRTHPLPAPFFVIATQNPAHQLGTYPLPEAQLDRFLMRVRLGYPDRAAERKLLKNPVQRAQVADLAPCLTPVQLLAAQAAAQTMHVSDALLDYVQALLEASRRSQAYLTGLSPRAGLALLRAAQAWAWLAGRNHVLPEDVQAVLGPVVGHRLQGSGAAEADPEALVGPLAAVPIP